MCPTRNIVLMVPLLLSALCGCLMEVDPDLWKQEVKAEDSSSLTFPDSRPPLVHDDGGLPADRGQADGSMPDIMAPDIMAPDVVAPDVITPDSVAPDSVAPDATVDSAPPKPDLPAPDLQPPPQDIERTLTYSGSGGASWLHLFYRATGANAISARTVRISGDVIPPWTNVTNASIPRGACRSAAILGNFPDGKPFISTVSYCFDGDQVQVSHKTSVDGGAPSPSQSHGAVSMDPFAAGLPFEASLHFHPSGGTDWLHVARRAPGAVNVDVQTQRYSGALVPATRDYVVFAVAPDSCKSKTLDGEFAASGEDFTVRVKYCRAGEKLTIQHDLTVAGTTGPIKKHGTITID